MMVKEAIDPSGSVPPNPVTRVLLLGGMLKLTFVVTGGWLFGFGVGTGVGVGVGVVVETGSVATVAVAGLLRPWLSVAL